jgi:hypothetical protein
MMGGLRKKKIVRTFSTRAKFKNPHLLERKAQLSSSSWAADRAPGEIAPLFLRDGLGICTGQSLVGLGNRNATALQLF